jgi:hypothetical protein
MQTNLEEEGLQMPAAEDNTGWEGQGSITLYTQKVIPSVTMNTMG